MNKKFVLITPDVMEECLSECLDSIKDSVPFIEKKITSNVRIKKPLK